jgi:hypothetical protein
MRRGDTDHPPSPSWVCLYLVFGPQFWGVSLSHYGPRSLPVGGSLFLERCDATKVMVQKKRPGAMAGPFPDFRFEKLS